MSVARTAPDRGTLTRRAAIASMSVALMLVVLKSWAAWSTGSVAMLGSLADTALDLFASFVTFLGVRWAAMPADDDHRFGHGKAESLAALIQTILITISALGIGWRAIDRLFSGAPTQGMELGIGVSIVAMLATFALLAYQRGVIRATGSVAIETDNVHYQSDLLLNAAVIAALAIDQWLGWHGADAAFGLLIALWLMYGAFKAANTAVNHLMDREWSREELDDFVAVAREHPELAGMHDLRTRSSGAWRFAQFHVWVPGDWTVQHAHDRMDRVEAALQDRFPGTEILIHLDPEGHTDRETMLRAELAEQKP